jgi:NADH:ubiquinone oxidoreductase subunit 6 (subunit J)
LALVVSGILVATAIMALSSRRVSVSLITLFYSSLMLGIIFTLYGSVLIGLLHIITFAGAVSVMILTVVLMTGESDLDIGLSPAKVGAIGGALVVVVGAALVLLGGLPPGVTASQLSSALSPLQFVWQLRPWDLLILLMLFASSMIVVVNLLSKEHEQ